MYYLLFSICLISRLITSIYYIEDIDSLRFALGIMDEYNISKFQPHFPGYSIFCFFAIFLYKITGSLALTFSIIGGISTYVIVYFSLKILKIQLLSKDSYLITLILFFNPMIWILSNRYMPDLMGVAVVLAVVYLITFSKNKLENYIGFILAGILFGVRLSYFPLIIIPIIFILLKRNNLFQLLISFLFGVLVWLIPFILTQGFDILIDIGLKHSSGHFNDFGGTIFTESNYFLRFKFLIQTIWSDGLGGYWLDRSWITIIISFMILYFLYQFILNRIKFNKNFKILLASAFLYLIWIFFFQNLIYKSRHVLPLVVIILLFFGYIIKNLNFKNISIILGLFLSILTINLVISHKNGTSIYFLKNYLQIQKKHFLVSNALVNYYLKSNGIKSNYINVDTAEINEINSKLEGVKEFKIIGNYSEIFETNYNISLDTIFYHNPYINRMWSEIPLYTAIEKQ